MCVYVWAELTVSDTLRENVRNYCTLELLFIVLHLQIVFTYYYNSVQNRKTVFFYITPKNHIVSKTYEFVFMSYPSVQYETYKL